jgi:hypothetical protein
MAISLKPPLHREPPLSSTATFIAVCYMGFAANICNLLCVPAKVEEAAVPHEHHMILIKKIDFHIN